MEMGIASPPRGWGMSHPAPQLQHRTTERRVGLKVGYFSWILARTYEKFRNMK